MVEYVPEAQFKHCNEAERPDIEDHVPSTQPMQVDTDVEPVRVEYVPKAQFTH